MNKEKRRLKIAYLKALQRGDKEQAASIKKELDGKVVVISSFTEALINHERMKTDTEIEFRLAKNTPFAEFLKQYGYDNTSNKTS